MKIGLLTFHRADNMGAMLQAFALQQSITDMGADCEFVDFPIMDKPTLAETFSSNMKNADYFVKKVAEEGRKRRFFFSDFREKYLKISRVYNDTSHLNADYDLFIAGSDQIWNFSVGDTDERYFLPFAENCKRYSYAASFGGDEVSDKKKQFVCEELSRFKKISVREKSGAKIVSELIGRETVICLDPVFLLSGDEWVRQMNLCDSKEHYVFVYMVQYSNVLVDDAKTYAMENGCGVRIMTSFFTPRAGFEAWSGYGVRDFLALVKGAQKVFTNSFHGMAFSIIFEKEFMVYPLTGNLKTRNDRIRELLAHRENLEEECEKSRQYLRDILRMPSEN